MLFGVTLNFNLEIVLPNGKLTGVQHNKKYYPNYPWGWSFFPIYQRIFYYFELLLYISLSDSVHDYI